MELGDQRWDPGESELRILEGPELGQQELTLGRGWNNAERSASDVTARLLREAATDALVVAVLAQTPAGGEAATALLSSLGVRTIDWAALRARIVAAATVVAQAPLALAEVPVALLLVENDAPSSAWLFEAGLALGALGGRAIVAQLGEGVPPAELRDLAVIRLDPGRPASLHALAERLRQTGARG